MHEDTVRTRAFAMPLTSPAYPIGPYRFRNREYLIITYRTDPQKLRELVPEPLQVREPLVKFEFIRMPDSTGFGGVELPLRSDRRVGRTGELAAAPFAGAGSGAARPPPLNLVSSRARAGWLRPLSPYRSGQRTRLGPWSRGARDRRRRAASVRLGGPRVMGGNGPPFEVIFLHLAP
jgi:hypothetical protein